MRAGAHASALFVLIIVKIFHESEFGSITYKIILYAYI